MDFSSAGSVEIMTGSGKYSNWRLLSTSVLESKVTFSLYIPVSIALFGLQSMFPLTDNALILRIISVMNQIIRMHDYSFLDNF